MAFKNWFSGKHFCSLTLVCAMSGLAIFAQAADGELDALADSQLDSRQASQLVRSLQSDPDLELGEVLEAMKGRSAISKNWLLSVAQTVADRNVEKSMAELEQFLPKLSEDADARYWAFRFVTRGDVQKKEQLLESMLADPSLELRFEAVELGMARLANNESLSREQLLSGYQELLAAARLPSQVQEVAAKLKELGAEVDLLKHFGFVAEWRLVGTFDNVGKAGFDVVYGPEKEYAQGKLSINRKYEGKSGEVSWKSEQTDKPDGVIDLNAIFNNEKGAVVYALGEFQSEGQQSCEVRIGSPNACKVWVNGDLLISREVYHTGSQIDQYAAPVTLRPGVNAIFVKVCQNEQSESWAQDWQLQLRFTDSTGLAIQASR